MIGSWYWERNASTNPAHTSRIPTPKIRVITGDLMTLIFGVGILLVWAGFVEAFLSQYHEPIIPYWLKISFGTAELCLLTLFLACSGAGRGGDLVGSDRQ